MSDTSPQTGLSDAQVLAARNTSGWNELPEVAQAGPWRVFVRQFTSLLVIILIIAAIIAAALGEYIDAATI